MYEAKPLDLLPGIFMEASNYAAQGRYINGSNVRFWKGYPERIGGNDTIANQQLFRPARCSVAWRALDTTQLIAFGHSYGVHVLTGGNIYDVTPQGTNGYARFLLTVGAVTGGPYQTNETVTTPNGGTGKLTQASASSPLYVSAHNGTHKLLFSGGSGTFLEGETVTATGGGTARVMIGGSSSPIYLYDVSGTMTGTLTGAVSGASCTITSATDMWTGQVVTGGTSTATSTISAFADNGLIDSGATTAWGQSSYGSSVFGGTESLYASVVDCTTWTLVNWGEDLIANVRGGRIYTLDVSVFDSTLPTVTHMTALGGDTPINALGVFMNQDNRTLVAYGAYDGAANDYCNIRWCDEENNTLWTADASNTAGSIRCENGSLIVGAMPARGGWLVSTDTALYSFRFIGLPFVFSLQQLAIGPTMVSPKSGVEQDGVTYWMGTDGFYQYDGSVSPLPCDVHQYVFGRINLVQRFKIYAGSLRAYNEIWWFYVSANGLEVDSYVCYNTVEKTWHVGSKSRTTWLDKNVVVSYPVGTKADGTIHAEEYGTTDHGTPINYTLETSDIEIDDGSTFLHNRKLIVDFKRISGTVAGQSHSVTIEARGWPNRTAVNKGPYYYDGTTEQLSVRARGRTLRFSFAGSDDIRWGRWRYRIAGDAEKP